MTLLPLFDSIRNQKEGNTLISSIALNPIQTDFTLPNGSKGLKVIKYFDQPRLVLSLGDGDPQNYSFIAVTDGSSQEGQYIDSFVTGGTLYHLIEIDRK